MSDIGIVSSPAAITAAAYKDLAAGLVELAAAVRVGGLRRSGRGEAVVGATRLGDAPAASTAVPNRLTATASLLLRIAGTLAVLLLLYHLAHQVFPPARPSFAPERRGITVAG